MRQTQIKLLTRERRKSVGATVLEHPPLAVPIAPHRQRLPQQRQRRRPAGVQIIHDGQRIPLPIPVVLLRRRRLSAIQSRIVQVLEPTESPLAA